MREAWEVKACHTRLREITGPVYIVPTPPTPHRPPTARLLRSFLALLTLKISAVFCSFFSLLCDGLAASVAAAGSGRGEYVLKVMVRRVSVA